MHIPQTNRQTPDGSILKWHVCSGCCLSYKAVRRTVHSSSLPFPPLPCHPSPSLPVFFLLFSPLKLEGCRMRYESPTWGVELSRRRQTFFDVYVDARERCIQYFKMHVYLQQCCLINKLVRGVVLLRHVPVQCCPKTPSRNNGTYF